MRISNIAQYLGGADNVVAREITLGDQFTQTITATGSGIPFDAANLDLDYALYKANVSRLGSSITLNSFERVQRNGSDIGTKTLSQFNHILSPRSEAFDMLVPTYLLSQFGSNSFNFGGRTREAGSDSAVLKVYDVSLSGTLPASGTLAVGSNNFAYSSFTPNAGFDENGSYYQFTLVNSQTWDLDEHVQVHLNQLDADITPTIDSENPFIVVQSLRWDYNGEIRTIRFLWIVRYAPSV